MQALKDMFKSERGVFALALIAAATTLCAIDKMTIDAWREMALYVFGIYVGGKTISGTAAALASARREVPVVVAPSPAPVDAPKPADAAADAPVEDAPKSAATSAV